MPARTEHAVAFLSKVNNADFLNVEDRNDPGMSGYFFIRLLDIKPNKIIAASVSDSTCQNLTNPAEVRNRIAKNIDNPGFYSDTVELFWQK